MSYPALILTSLDGSFMPKRISLAGGEHVTIGRTMNDETNPTEGNGRFDTKVLSRQHAEVYEQDGKIFIKDMKSYHGTFVNDERLSAEAQESDPRELHTGDIIVLAIDIVGEDKKTVVHGKAKVTAKVTCVFSENDAIAA